MSKMDILASIKKFVYEFLIHDTSGRTELDPSALLHTVSGSMSAEILMTVAIIVIVFILNWIGRHWIGVGFDHIERRLGRTQELKPAFRGIVTALLVWLAALGILHVWGIGASVVWTGIIGATTIVGAGFLAFWTIISNITAHLFLAGSRPFRTGDYVEMLPEEVGGTVRQVGAMLTELEQDNGRSIFVPNNFFFQRMFVRIPAHGAKAPVGPRRSRTNRFSSSLQTSGAKTTKEN